MTPEEAHQEALRRIHQAVDAEIVALDLSGLEFVCIPADIEILGDLHSLDISRCMQVSDLQPLQALTSLHSLDIHG